MTFDTTKGNTHLFKYSILVIPGLLPSGERIEMSRLPRLLFSANLVLYLGIFDILSKASSCQVFGLQWTSPSIKVDSVSHSYPVSLWRKLTSSEPRREYALENVSITFDKSGLWMLLGASQSGKSTILKIIQGTETPTSGSLQICDDESNAINPMSLPIVLDERPLYDNQQTVGSIWSKAWGPTKGETSLEEGFSKIVDEMENIFELSSDQTAGSLSPSELYRCRLGEAAMQSVCLSVSDSLVSAPILLLDEWMDKETSTVVRKVQPCLQRMIQDQGAVIISVTHKPKLYDVNEGTPKIRQITLSRGRILSTI